jgi:hypothetical protein
MASSEATGSSMTSTASSLPSTVPTPDESKLSVDTLLCMICAGGGGGGGSGDSASSAALLRCWCGVRGGGCTEKQTSWREVEGTGPELEPIKLRKPGGAAEGRRYMFWSFYATLKIYFRKIDQPNLL